MSSEIRSETKSQNTDPNVSLSIEQSTKHTSTSSVKEQTSTFQSSNATTNITGIIHSKDELQIDRTETTTVIRKKRKKSLATTNLNSPISPQIKPVKVITDGSFIKATSIDVTDAYPPAKYDKEVIQLQKQLIVSLKIPKISSQPHILTVCKYVISQLKEQYPELTEKLSHSVETKDQLSLVNLLTDLIDTYQQLNEQRAKPTILNSILEIITFISRFPPAKYLPQDAAIQADKCASKEEHLSNQLHLISKALNSDFLDSEVYQHLLQFLLFSNSIHIQKLRWIILNISNDRIIEFNIQNQNLPPKTFVSRLIEIPDLTEEELTISNNYIFPNPRELVHNTSKSLDLILEFFNEQNSE